MEPRNELADAIVRLPMKTANTLADGGKPLSLIRREAPFQIMYIMAAVDISKYDVQPVPNLPRYLWSFRKSRCCIRQLRCFLQLCCTES